MLKCVIFDLDGTLTDSAPLITNTVRETMRALAGVDKPADAYLPFVGPPLRDGFAHEGVDPAHIDAYINDYRERYERVQDKTPVFLGVPDMLAQLKKSGVRLAIATSKQREVAIEVCEAIGLSRYFDYIAGAVSPINLPQKPISSVTCSQSLNHALFSILPVAHTKIHIVTTFSWLAIEFTILKALVSMVSLLCSSRGAGLRRAVSVRRHGKWQAV